MFEKYVMVATLNGETLYFEDREYNEKQKDSIQKIADTFKRSYIESKDHEEEIFTEFVNKVKNELDIQLNPVKISYVIRL
jgi:hypothetical protein